ncbi:DUF6442 family protein [Desemzia sp. FAM 24101]|uniref:DUF6442 family protein n=1 Tax=unclassified Desemzia TaxID=2685243 RepID=UPI00388A87B1
MDKEKILEKYRSEKKDEGKDYDNDYSDNQGFYAMCFLAILLMTYQIFNDLPFGDIAALLFAFMAVGGFYRYKLRKDKGDLYFSLFTGMVGLAFLIWYVVQTI